MKAVIMAGGKGTRLRPLTVNRPKPMVPIANRPMMEHIVNLLKKYDFTEVMVTLFYLPDAIRSYFEEGENFGMKFHYFVEDTPLGTAGSVRNGAGFLDETFLVISGDTLTDIDLGAAIRFHKERNATATLILTKVQNPLEYGVVITDEEGRIRRFLEKPGWGEVFSDTVNTGIYILDPKVFNYFPQGKVFDFSKDLFPLLLERNEPLYGFVAHGYWSDIGNLEQYRQAHYDILSGKVQINDYGRETAPGIRVGEGTEIAPDAILEPPLILGERCRIHAGTRIGAFSIIGDDVTIQKNSEIERSILWDYSFIGENVEIRGAVLGQRNFMKGRNRIFEGAVLGENVAAGQKAVIKSQIKVWPDKKIDSGAILTESLIWAKGGAKNLFGNSGISGVVNREMTPEFVAKLGAVFAAHLKPGSSMVVSGDDFRASRVLKRAFISGALAGGVGVYDLGTLTTPMTRYALIALDAHGGVHLHQSTQDNESVRMKFLDRLGLNIDKSTERALENAFFSEDFPRAETNRLGELTFVPQLIAPYLQGLVAPQARDFIRASRFQIVAAYDGGSLGLVLPQLFQDLECQVHNLELVDRAPAHPRPFQELLHDLHRVAAKVRESGADLGIVVDNNAERLILLDENGEILKEEQLTALLSFQILKSQPEATVPVQVTAPEFLEEMAREYRGRIVRTKVHPRSLMERMVQEKLFPAADGKSAYHPQFDALFSLVMILELLSQEKITLAGAKALIPQVERGYQEVDCPWEEKGRVMRNLFEENKENRLEMTDGLKVFHNEGWALVLPDAEEPIFKIYTEAGTLEEADALSRLYMARIGELQLQ